MKTKLKTALLGSLAKAKAAASWLARNASNIGLVLFVSAVVSAAAYGFYFDYERQHRTYALTLYFQTAEGLAPNKAGLITDFRINGDGSICFAPASAPERRVCAKFPMYDVVEASVE